MRTPAQSVVLGAPLRPILGALPLPSSRGCWARPRSPRTPRHIFFPGVAKGLSYPPFGASGISAHFRNPPIPALHCPGGGTNGAMPAWGLVVLWPRRLLLAGQWGAL